MYTPKKYSTRDNGGTIFQIKITTLNDNEHIVNIKSYVYENTFNATQVFIGKSPHNTMTAFSCEYGSRYDGNSIVIKIQTGEYIYIGESIFSFRTESPIVEHVSPVGNNDVPYPYSILENGKIYLMIENVVLAPTENLNNYMSNTMNDPYSYYYENHNITPDIRGQRNPTNKYDENFPYFREIREFYIGGEQYTLSYNSNSFDDFVRFKTCEDFKNPSTHGDEVDIYILVGKDLNKIIFSIDSYVDMINSFGNEKGFSTFEKTVICARQ
jgi:hypothetical protein